MTEREPTTETTAATPETRHMLAPLIHSLPVASVVYVFLILGFVLSTILFLVQLRYEVEPGILLIDSRSGRLVVFAHLARACACLLLSLSLHKYIASLRRIRGNAPDATDRFFKASRFLWNTLCICALLVVGFGVWAFDVSRDPAADFASGVETYAAPPQADAIVEFYLAETSPGEGLEEHVIPASGDSIWLPQEPVLSNEHFLEAQINLDQYQNRNINVKLNQEGAALISKASQKHRSKPLAILVDGKIIMAPTIHDAVGSEFTIAGAISLEEAERIARSLSRKQ
ncbi:SecDF P1 head subdomain-containing protein [Gimesia sp.]|uniref:SecDF P1 head subdomain-containing protein n=1 Tax=Gimesia sp. TaxID=2024833 RepID=UPI003A90F3BC